MKIDESGLTGFGDVVATELAAKLKSSLDFMSAFCPVGAVVPILTDIPGVPTPDPNIWQECDGSEIVNPNSPLRSQGDSIRRVPNMIDRYIRMPITFGLSGQTGGFNSTLMFRHNHGGKSNRVSTGGAIRGGHNKRHALSHFHGINYSFNNLVNVEPPYYTVRFYMRIQ